MRTIQQERTRPHAAPFGTPTLTAVLCLAFVGNGLFAPPAMATGSQSDVNRDGVVDLEDLKLFSSKTLGQDWQTVDWCVWAKVDGKLQAKYDELADFIIVYFECNAPPEPPPPPPGPLDVKNELLYPTRMAWGPNGRLFVSDAKVESVFIYEVIPADIGPSTLNLTGELKHVGKVVGMAVSSSGLIYVGDGQRKRVEKYNLKGEMVGTLGYGILRAPSDLTFDSNGNLYVADGESDVVWVFAPDGSLLRTVRRGGLKRPTAVEVTYVDDGTGNLVGELFVASKGDYLVKVFDLEGNFLRSFGGFPDKEGWFNPVWLWEGKFIGLQSLAVDGNGNVHALDVYMAKGQILDPITGAFITSYGELGTDPGQLSLPMDVIISDAGEVIVANADLHRVEVIYTIP